MNFILHCKFTINPDPWHFTLHIFTSILLLHSLSTSFFSIGNAHHVTWSKDLCFPACSHLPPRMSVLDQTESFLTNSRMWFNDRYTEELFRNIANHLDSRVNVSLPSRQRMRKRFPLSSNAKWKKKKFSSSVPTPNDVTKIETITQICRVGILEQIKKDLLVLPAVWGNGGYVLA